MHCSLLWNRRHKWRRIHGHRRGKPGTNRSGLQHGLPQQRRLDLYSAADSWQGQGGACGCEYWWCLFYSALCWRQIFSFEIEALWTDHRSILFLPLFLLVGQQVDNDGDLDMIASVSYGRFHSIFRNDGTGQFSADANPLPTPGDTIMYPRQYIVVDLNGDRWLDIIIGNGSTGENKEVFVLMNDGTGGDWTIVSVDGTDVNPVHNMALLDVPHDAAELVSNDSWCSTWKSTPTNLTSFHFRCPIPNK